MLDKLSDSLKGTLKKIASSIFIDKKVIDELVKDLQRALLQADVDVKLVYELTKKIKGDALKEPAAGLTKKEQIINIVYNHLVEFLGKEPRKIEISSKPFVIMFIGLYGSGKTTSSGKLAKFYLKRGYKVALVGLDVHRAAAMDQLEQVAKSVNAPSFTEKNEKNPLKIWNSFKDKLNEFDIIIVDTSGRDALSEDLIEEISVLHKSIKPNETILVLSADIGQAAHSQVEKFHSTCNITGIFTTKMDSTARAGGTLTACAITKAPVLFIGTGEKPDDLEQFNPTGFVSRLLGMGDLEALLEKAQDAISEEQAKDLGKKFIQGDFTLIDLYEQMNAMKKLGPLGKIAELIPGFGNLNIPKDVLETQEHKLEQWKFAMDSMTKDELTDPDNVIDTSRIERISNGSGISQQELRQMLKQYKMSKKMMKTLKDEKGIERMMKKMGGKVKF